jgi:hypothetical protein
LNALRARACKICANKCHSSLQKCIVETRNTDVSAKLNAKYLGQTNACDANQPILKVFCISNTLYWKERHKPASQYLPHLELSGIRDMRRHFIAKVADSQVRLAKAYMQNHIPDVVRDLGFWAEHGAGSLSAERRIAVQKTLSKIEEQLEEVRAPVHDNEKAHLLTRARNSSAVDPDLQA